MNISRTMLITVKARLSVTRTRIFVIVSRLSINPPLKTAQAVSEHKYASVLHRTVGTRSALCLSYVWREKAEHRLSARSPTLYIWKNNLRGKCSPHIRRAKEEVNPPKDTSARYKRYGSPRCPMLFLRTKTDRYMSPPAGKYRSAASS